MELALVTRNASLSAARKCPCPTTGTIPAPRQSRCRIESNARALLVMKQWMPILDRLIYGKTAVACALTRAVLLFFMILQPLPWRHFPNVIRIISGSWLFLVMSGALVSSALSAVAKRRGVPIDMVACVVVGVVWKFTPVFLFLPFNFGRLLIIYGLAGLLAHCIRRSRSSSPASVVSSSLAPKATSPGSDLEAKQ